MSSLNQLKAFYEFMDWTWVWTDTVYPQIDDSLIRRIELELTGTQREIYVHRLLSLGTPFQAMTATAEQRANELLKTIGRWKD